MAKKMSAEAAEERAKRDAMYAAEAERLTTGMEAIRESCRKEVAGIARDIEENDGIITDRRIEALVALQTGMKALHSERFIYTLRWKDTKNAEDRARGDFSSLRKD